MSNFVRMRELTTGKGREGILPVAESTIRLWVKKGVFPKPINLGVGKGVAVWRREVITAWIAAREAKALEAEAA